MKAIMVSVLLATMFAGAAMASDAKVIEDGGAIADGGAASQPAATVDPTDPNAPKSGGEALEAGKGLVELAKAKKWFAFSAGAIWLLMFFFKLGRDNLAFMKKIPKRVLWITVPVLSIVAMLLAKLQGDLSWGAAIAVLTSGPCAAFANDLVKRGILNKESSPMGPVVS